MKFSKKYKKDKRYEASLKILDEGFEDSFTYLNNEEIHTRLKSTNCLERLNEEIREREKVIRIFPNTESAYRLIGSILMDKDEEWLSSERIYIKSKNLFLPLKRVIAFKNLSRIASLYFLTEPFQQLYCNLGKNRSGHCARYFYTIFWT